jgi:uridine kinase
MSELLTDKKSALPVYDFIKGEKFFKGETTLFDKEVLIIEGLHSLNPILNKYVPQSLTVRCFISTEKQYSSAGEVKIDNFKLRLIRRMLRDVKHRGYDPIKTLEYWPNVRAGEDKYVLPFKETANFCIDSTHAYELRVYKKILEDIKDKYPESISQLLNLLKDFKALDEKLIPKTSVIQEFIN